MLNEKIALITGASRGIGRATAIKFAENGAFIGINYLSNDDAAKQTLKLVKKAGSDGILLKADVSKPKEVELIVKELVNKKNQVDILINNAGIYLRHSFDKLDFITWNKIINNNLTSCYNVCKIVISHMKQNSKIVFISSQLAFRGSTHGADYATTKAGILGLMRSLALELGEKKINVNAIAPGVIDTDLLSNYSNEMKSKRAKEVPLKRLGTADDIANTCLFLSSNMSNYITGETINVNGGLYIH